MIFKPVNGSVSFPQLETEILQFWRERQIYEKSLQFRSGAQRFVFFEGPPTANGMPHPGHCLTRAIKDLFPRYRTMRGYRCDRKAGWDTHGLPVEVEVCKELGIHSKVEIEAYGVEPFIHKCQESVWRYMQQWERLTERIGFWIHLDEAYVTYHQAYVESVWWALKSLFDRGLLYQGHKIVWWWAQGGTALSSGEVGQGYREVADPSVYVRFPLLDARGEKTGTSLLVWTTTPWTLPGNQFVAVHPAVDYAMVRDEDGTELVIAANLLQTLQAKFKRKFEIVSTCQGMDLIGRRYAPPFDDYYAAMKDQRGTLRTDEAGLANRGIYHLQHCRMMNDPAGDDRTVEKVKALIQRQSHEYVAWRVVPAEFVTLDSGTGLVHEAPAFGEVDYDVLLQQQELFDEGEGPQLINPVAPDGTFTANVPDYQGRWVKDCDKDIIRSLRDRGLLFHQEQYVHDYPFCWRAEDDPLIQYPRKSWFVRTTQFKEQMLENNRRINWLPEHIRDGRFGNFLESNVDWALSRERYWGTPLPIWVCQATGYQEAIANYDQLLAKPGVHGMDAWKKAKQASPHLPDDLKVHKPYIDQVTYDSPRKPGARMRRVPEVIDCWFDSGAMPFAQWGYPRQGKERFAQEFPADFISEAIDQTRGWFYSQLAISTMLFGDERSTDAERPPAPLPHPFRNCIVLGLMLGEDGGKMSKSKRNYREPAEIFDRYGADALRWYFFANQPPWTAIRYSEQAIRDSIPEFLLRLWNVYSFFVTYANIDAFNPNQNQKPEPAGSVPRAMQAGQPNQLSSGDLAKNSGYRPLAQRAELDRWVLSELHRTAAAVTRHMDAYDNYAACQAITQFVDALSNWYVRRSRDRFWSGDTTAPHKWDAHWTLYECLLTTSKLIAPFVPFIAEALWQNLACQAWKQSALESVHLCDFPVGDAACMDEGLSQRMDLLREIASLGRGARMNAKLKVRQPLAKVEVILAGQQYRKWLLDHAALIEEELNVKQVEFTETADQYIRYSVAPDFKRLGPRLGKQMPAVKQALAQADAAKLLARLKLDGRLTLSLADGDVTLDEDDLHVRLDAKPGWTAAQGPNCVVVLSTDLTDELVQEGLARDVVRMIQDRRKELQCNYTDRIAVGAISESAELQQAIGAFSKYIMQETLAVQLELAAINGTEPVLADVAGHELKLFVKVVPPGAMSND